MALTLPNSIDGSVGARNDHAFFEAVWHDTESPATGYVVIDRLIRGVSSGGLRMRAGCTLDEVRGLARGMTLKEGVHYEPGARYVPFGGAKGGIDFDPYSPEADDVLRRFLQAMAPLIEQRWTMGEDFGVQQATVDRILPEIGAERLHLGAGVGNPLADRSKGERQPAAIAVTASASRPASG